MAELLKSTQLDNVAIEIYVDRDYVTRRHLQNFYIIQCYNSISKKMYFQYVFKDVEIANIESEAHDLYNYLVELLSDYECYKCGAMAFRLAEYPTESKVITLYEGGKEIGLSTA